MDDKENLSSKQVLCVLRGVQYEQKQRAVEIALKVTMKPGMRDSYEDQNGLTLQCQTSSLAFPACTAGEHPAQRLLCFST